MASLPYKTPRGMNLAWIAGWLEGEGCYFANVRGRLRTSICASSIDEDTLLRVQAIVGGSVTGPYQAAKGGAKFYNWALYNKHDCIKLMKAMYPLMSARRQEQIAATVLTIQASETPVSAREVAWL